MGLSRTNGRKHTSRGERLTALAEELLPATPPWWVDRPTRATPAQGWYWIPQGGKSPSFLGASSIRAEMALLEMIDALG